MCYLLTWVLPLLLLLSMIPHDYSLYIKYLYIIAPGSLRKYPALHQGEEITDSYGVTFLETDRETRQRGLWAKYNFHCSCVACTEGYPLLQV